MKKKKNKIKRQTKNKITTRKKKTPIITVLLNGFETESNIKTILSKSYTNCIKPKFQSITTDSGKKLNYILK